MQFFNQVLIFLLIQISTSLSLNVNIDHENHPCKRICKDDQKSMVCRYEFVVEQYMTLSKACYDCPNNVADCFRPHCIPGDGVKKVVYSVNRQIPGPTIEICENDEIEVQVENKMLSESTSIHWHGIKQTNTPYMDGVPYVSQCPILAGQNFTYRFRATDSGTFYYHGHMGSQAGDGLFGPLIVHKTLGNEMKQEYEIYPEHIVMLNVWHHRSAAENFVMTYHDNFDYHDPPTILVNGLGRRELPTSTPNHSKYTPTAEFQIEQGKTYRFRVILGGFDDCPVRMKIDNHEMHVVSMDGNEIEPVTVDAITLMAGERVDFLLKANQKRNVYLIRFAGYILCEGYDREVAFLRYKGAKNIVPKVSNNSKRPHKLRVFNPYNIGTESSSPYHIVIPNLKSLERNDPSIIQDEPDYRFYVSFDFNEIDNNDFHHPIYYGYKTMEHRNQSMLSLQLNHISMQMPTVPLMSQWDYVKNDSFCSYEILSKNIDCTIEHCQCTHVLNVDLNSTVELILIDEGSKFDANHPFHLHGHSFRVVAEEQLGGVVSVDRVKQLDRDGKIVRNLDHAPIKDTIQVSHGGFTIVRFFANNPGYWLFHCHVEEHLMAGMALIFKVGEHQDFPAIPENFPKCGVY